LRRLTPADRSTRPLLAAAIPLLAAIPHPRRTTGRAPLPAPHEVWLRPHRRRVKLPATGFGPFRAYYARVDTAPQQQFIPIAPRFRADCQSTMHARSASAHAIAITRGVRLPVGSSDDRNVRENRKSTGSKNCASTPYTGPWSRSSTRYRARVSLTLNSNRNSVAGLNGRAPLTYMRSPHSEHSMCSSPVVSVTRVTSWLHHHVSFLHSRFIIALPLSANRGLRPQT